MEMQPLTADEMILQPVVGFELTNEHTNERTNQQTRRIAIPPGGDNSYYMPTSVGGYRLIRVQKDH